MRRLTCGSCFTGAGGMDIGLECAGIEIVWQIENNPFCRKVLDKRWAKIPKYGDITAVNEYDLEHVHLIAGGFPCTDISLEGDRAGIDGDRSGLWRDMFRIIRVVRPIGVLVENVAAITMAHRDGRPAPLCRVLADLASIGFHASWSLVSACSVGASHMRPRVFVVAYSDVQRLQRWLAQRERERTEALPQKTLRRDLSPPYVCGGADGIPDRAHRLKALGNAVYPDCAEWIGRRLMEAAHDAA